MRGMSPQDAVNKLAAAGWTEQRIASEAGTTQPTINRIKNGRQRAAFDIGQSLVALAAKADSDAAAA